MYLTFMGICHLYTHASEPSRDNLQHSEGIVQVTNGFCYYSSVVCEGNVLLLCGLRGRFVYTSVRSRC